MSRAAFDSVRNQHERAVFDEIDRLVGEYPMMQDAQLLADVACVALNRLPPRYIRHEVDFAFYLSENERNETEQLVREAVIFSFEFVQARVAMRARR